MAVFRVETPTMIKRIFVSEQSAKLPENQCQYVISKKVLPRILERVKGM